MLIPTSGCHLLRFLARSLLLNVLDGNKMPKFLGVYLKQSQSGTVRHLIIVSFGKKK